MKSLISILPALIVFGILIIVHEFGHFIAAKRLGVRVAAVNVRRRELILNPGWALNDAELRYVLAHMTLHAIRWPAMPGT